MPASIDDPIDIFKELLERAAQTSVEPDAMVLSTVDENGRASGRYVLLKGVDTHGFVFYTNLESRKARALSANPSAALCFYWPSIEKQVRVEGTVERVSDADADAYFATRPRESQLGAWASRQSASLESRDALDRRVSEARARFEIPDLHFCRACDRPFVVPASVLDVVGDDRYLVELECMNCGTVVVRRRPRPVRPQRQVEQRDDHADDADDDEDRADGLKLDARDRGSHREAEDRPNGDQQDGCPYPHVCLQKQSLAGIEVPHACMGQTPQPESC